MDKTNQRWTMSFQTVVRNPPDERVETRVIGISPFGRNDTLCPGLN